MRAMAAEALRENSLAPVFPKGLPVLLVRKSGAEIYAVANKCSHMGCPLSRGRLDGYILQCPCHDWRFDVRTGAFLDAPEIRLPLYGWQIADGQILIRLPRTAL